MKDIKLYLDGLNCANCAGKIEDKVNKDSNNTLHKYNNNFEEL